MTPPDWIRVGSRRYLDLAKVWGVLFSPDGRRAAVSTPGRTLHLRRRSEVDALVMELEARAGREHRYPDGPIERSVGSDCGNFDERRTA